MTIKEGVGEVMEAEQIGGALVVSGDVVPDQIMTRRPPDQVLDEASQAARALKRVMDGKAKKVVMNGEQYIENEDWITIGRFYGLTAKLESDRYVEYGDARGFEATVVVVDVNGIERGRATMMCLDDEEKWGARNKYGWAYVLKNGDTVTDEPANPFQVCELEQTGKMRDDGSPVMRPKKIKTLIGTEKTPLFQLRSMAQTRASSKALNMLLRFVPVLAGYKGTPAEEMEGMAQSVEVTEVEARAVGGTQSKAAQAQQTRTTQQQRPAATQAPQAQQTRTTQQQRPAATQAPQSQARTISEAQVKRLWAITRDVGLDEQAVGDAIAQKYGVESSAGIKRSDYDKIIDAIRDGSIVA